MIKKALLILGCLYLYVTYVSQGDKMELVSQGIKAYQTVTQSFKEKNIQIDAKKWDLDEPIAEPKTVLPKQSKKRRSF